ncbi:MAG: hypothetical protein RSE10_08335, partial [Oscillospiraceae bacterium]
LPFKKAIPLECLFILFSPLSPPAKHRLYAYCMAADDNNILGKERYNIHRVLLFLAFLIQ